MANAVEIRFQPELVEEGGIGGGGLGLGLAALLLHEQVSWTMLLATLAAVICVAGAKKHAR